MKKIKLVIESDLDNVALVGMSVKKICSLTPLSKNQSFWVELCAVEAINNSIIHAYCGAQANEVETVISINKKYLALEIKDTGKPMSNEILDRATIKHLAKKAENSEIISESGRGLAVIKEFMDKVSYKSDENGNRLIMIKYF